MTFGRLFVLASLCACSNALIEDLLIENDDRNTFHIESFGYLEGGVFNFEIKDFFLLVPHDFTLPGNGKFNVQFVLQRSDSEVGYDTSSKKCYHESFIGPEDSLISMEDRTDWNNKVASIPIHTPGYYHLYYSNCVGKAHSSFELVTKQYNVNAQGTKIYLSTGVSSLPGWYFFFFVAFSVLLVVWGQMQKKDWTNVKSIHHLMTVTVVFKILSLFCEAFRFYVMKYEGVHDGWSAAFYIFEFVKGMLMFTAIVLIGTGWSYLKPFLTERDRQLILAVLVLQGSVNTAMIVVDESTPGSYAGVRWTDILHILDILCCSAILFPIIWSIRHLRAASGTDSKAQRNASRLQNFRTFYLLVVSYVYFTRVVLYLLKAILGYESAWVAPVTSELASFVFYVSTGWLFRPQEQNPYLAIGKDDDDIDEISLDL